jgi:hypothetical protein
MWKEGIGSDGGLNCNTVQSYLWFDNILGLYKLDGNSREIHIMKRG